MKTSDRSSAFRRIRSVVTSAAFTVLIAVGFIVVPQLGTPSFQANLFQQTAGITNPARGVFISKSYQAQPNERGSVIVQAAESFTAFEGMHFTLVVDPKRVQILHVRTTAITDQFDISVQLVSPSLARVALVGKPRFISAGMELVDIGLDLADNSINVFGDRVDLRLLNMEYLANGTTISTQSSNGRIAILSNANVIEDPFFPMITDVEPSALSLVRERDLRIRGNALPEQPFVFLDSTPLRVLSASPTLIRAKVPSDLTAGRYTVTVDGMLAQEEVIVIRADGPTSQVDILDDVLFITPNPALHTAQTQQGVALWIPVFNPLGPDDSVNGSVDLSPIGGDPNITFSGIGTKVLGAGGVMLNWFRVPESGTFSLPPDLQTDADYPIAVRVENRADTLDEAVEVLQLRSGITQGQAPSFSAAEFVPAAPLPGDATTLFIDIADAEGVDTITLASVRLTSIGLDFVELSPVFSTTAGDVPITNMTFQGAFTVPTTASPGTYPLTVFARDTDGNETEHIVQLTIRAPGQNPTQPGNPPQFAGRREARPSSVNPGDDADFFVGVLHPDGVGIQSVKIDLIDIGGGVVDMSPAVDAPAGGFPVVYQASFALPSNPASGLFQLPVQVVDANGRGAATTIALTVNNPSGSAESAPVFSGRREAVPAAIAPGSDTTFFVSLFDPNGSDTIAQVLIDLVPLHDTERSMRAVVAPVPESTNTVLYSLDFTVPTDVAPGPYTLTVRAIDESGLETQTTLPLNIVSSQAGSAPQFPGRRTAQPDTLEPGDTVQLFIDVSDPNGTDTVALVLADFIDVGGSIQQMTRTVNPIAGSTAPVTYQTQFTLPTTAPAGSMTIPIRALDEDGNESASVIPLIINPLPGGSQGNPIFQGRLESVPAIAAPGETVMLYAELFDPDGTATIRQVTVDTINAFGSILTMQPVVAPVAGSTQTVVYSVDFALPATVSEGFQQFAVRAIDEDGNESSATIPLTIAASQGGGIGAPFFSGRLESVPSPAAPGETLSFVVSIGDPQGTSTIRQVSVDAFALGQDVGLVELRPAISAVQGSTDPILYTAEVDLPTAAKVGAFQLPVRAVDDDGNVAETALTTVVSALVQQGASPSILQTFATPDNVPADGRTSFTLTVEVQDADGVRDDIEVVQVNLSPLDQEITYLDLVRDSVAQNGRRGIYTSDSITVPTTVTSGTYNLAIAIEDAGGNRTQGTVSISVGQGSQGGDAPTIIDTRFLPEIVAPGEQVKLFVEVEDRNGTDTLTVFADFTEVRGEVEELDEVLDAPSGTLLQRNTFETSTLRIPDDLQQGVYDVPLTIIDDTNNVLRRDTRLRVQIGGEDEGREPLINIGQSFQVPRVFLNDDSNDGEMHILVSDADDDVLTVIANLRGHGRADSASVPDTAGDIELLCGTSDALACAQRGVPETATDRWFILEGVRIPPTTIPSPDPYEIELTAIDAKGHTSKATFPMYVGGGDTDASLQVPPELLLVVPVSSTALEVIVQPSMDTRSIDRAGQQFQIQETLDALAGVDVTGVSWDTAARLLYLQTNPLTPNRQYVLGVKPTPPEEVAPLTDTNGNRFSREKGGQITFTALEPTGEPPEIVGVDLLSDTLIDVQFSTPVLPSSVHPDVLQNRVSLSSLSSATEREIVSGVLHNAGRSLRMEIQPLREGDQYLLLMDGLTGPGPTAVEPPGASYVFFATFGVNEEGAIILPTADLDQDGDVDFDDFSLFSRVYNTEYDPAEAYRRLVLGEEADEDNDDDANDDSDGNGFGGPVPGLSF